jgi:protein-tyrosine-phosphatase
MAKGFFNTFSSSQSADSAGLKPEKYIDPYTIQVMSEVGIDVRFYVPKSLTLDMNNQFDIFILMASSTDFPSLPWEKTIQWSIQDPKGKSLDDYRIVRNTIQNHVETLLADMKKIKEK